MVLGEDGMKGERQRAAGDGSGSSTGCCGGDLTEMSTLRERGLGISPWRLSACIMILAMSYGLCMGMFAVFGVKGPSPMQVVASMVKVPLLFYLTLLVTLPSLYVFNALVGSRLSLAGGGAAADRVAGGERDRAGLAGADRGVLLGLHDELPVHGAAQRRGLRDRRPVRAEVLAPDAAPPECRRSATTGRVAGGARIHGPRPSPPDRSSPCEIARCPTRSRWCSGSGSSSSAWWARRWAGSCGLSSATPICRSPGSAPASLTSSRPCSSAISHLFSS